MNERKRETGPMRDCASAMSAPLGLTLLLLFAVCVVLLAGCSPSASSQHSPSSDAASGTSPSALASSASESDESSSSSVSAGDVERPASAASESGSSATSADVSNNIIVGSWRIYSTEYGNNKKTKIDNEAISAMREYGLFEAMTFFSDGTFQIDNGRGRGTEGLWEETGTNAYLLKDTEDNMSADSEELEAVVRSGLLTIEYDTDDRELGHVKLVFSKQ